jgi:Lysophospholipase L1 and related esterases
MRKLYLSFFLLLTLSAFSQTKTIAVIGSSTAQGVGATPEDSSWVRLLSYHFKNELGRIDTIYNRARGGSNNYHGMPTSYVPPANRDKPSVDSNVTWALSTNPDIVIVSYVSNNLHIYSIEETLFTLQVMMDSVRAAGKHCFITTSQPRNGFDEAGREKLRVIKDSILNRFGEFAINFYDPIVNPEDKTVLEEYKFPWDDVHLNNAGHRVLFEQVVAKNILDFAPLPVEIRNFSGALQNGQVLLKWSSFEEEPFTTYHIQRSSDGLHFETLGKIDAAGAPGEKKDSYTDKNPVGGANFYRLFIEQPSGNTYSKVISVRIELPSMVVKRIYSAVGSQNITVEIISPKANNARFDIIGSNGALIKSFTRSLYRQSNTINLPVGTLPSGSYYLRITSPGRKPVTQTFVK